MPLMYGSLWRAVKRFLVVSCFVYYPSRLSWAVYARRERGRLFACISDWRFWRASDSDKVMAIQGRMLCDVSSLSMSTLEHDEAPAWKKSHIVTNMAGYADYPTIILRHMPDDTCAPACHLTKK